MPLRSLNVGSLDRRPTLRYPVSAKDTLGTVIDGFADFGKVWSSELKQFSGREYFAADAKVAESTGWIRIRYKADIGSTWRILHDGQLYDIVKEFEFGRRNATDLLVRLLSEGGDPTVPTAQTFTVDLVEGEELKEVEYPLAFAQAPRGYNVQLVIPNGGYTFEADVVDGTVTTDGLSVQLGAEVPGPGYKLNFIIVL